MNQLATLLVVPMPSHATGLRRRGRRNPGCPQCLTMVDQRGCWPAFCQLARLRIMVAGVGRCCGDWSLKSTELLRAASLGMREQPPAGGRTQPVQSTAVARQPGLLLDFQTRSRMSPLAAVRRRLPCPWRVLKSSSRERPGVAFAHGRFIGAY